MEDTLDTKIMLKAMDLGLDPCNATDEEIDEYLKKAYNALVEEGKIKVRKDV